MKTFKIEIKETLAAVRAVQADTVDQAIAKVKNRYLNEEIVLDANHFVDVDFQSLEDSKEDCTNNIGNKSLQPIYEIVRIKAERRKLPKKYLSENLTDYTVRSPHDFAKIAMKFIGDEDREVFLVACLSTKNQIQSLHRCHIGSLNASIVTPREVFKTAFLQNAASIIISHNHPSQNCTPSPEDIDVTKRLKEAGELLGVELLDHLIICEHTFLSFREKGYM